MVVLLPPVSLPLESFPEMHTQRLRLRELVRADAPEVFRLFANPAVTRFYDLETMTSEQQAADLIERQHTRYRRGEAINWGITFQDSNIVIGSVRYVISAHNWQGGLGYDLAEPYWRRGIMTEALQTVIRFGFGTLKLNRLQALVMPGNIASERVLLKLGFIDEGLLREYAFFKGRFQDLRCFSLLHSDKPDWLRRD